MTPWLQSSRPLLRCFRTHLRPARKTPSAASSLRQPLHGSMNVAFY